MSQPKVLAIINPSSGRMAGRVEALTRALRESGPMHIAVTQQRLEAESIAARAVQDGVTRIIVAGGDGTACEVASGVLGAGGTHVELALLPLGTGRDFARSLGLSDDITSAIRAIGNGRRRTIDVVRLRAGGPGERVRHFLNVGSIGVSTTVATEIDRKIAQGRRHRLTYVQAGLTSLMRFHMPDVRITVDGEPVHDGRIALAAVANGRYFGGKMKVAPRAQLDDGMLDVIVVPAMSRARLICMFPSIFPGRHVGQSRVGYTRGRKVTLESAQGVALEVDGELAGVLPAEFQVLPRALTLCGLTSPATSARATEAS